MINRRTALAAPLLALPPLGLPLLGGCGLVTPRQPPPPSTTPPTPAPSLNADVRVILPQLRLTIQLPNEVSLRRSTHTEHPSYATRSFHGGWEVYSLPTSTKADTKTINGSHGAFHDASEVLKASPLRNLSTASGQVVAFTHTYSEYTNQKTDYLDALAFLTWATPPVATMPTVVVGWYRLAGNQAVDPAETVLKVAATIEPLP